MSTENGLTPTPKIQSGGGKTAFLVTLAIIAAFVAGSVLPPPGWLAGLISGQPGGPVTDHGAHAHEGHGAPPGDAAEREILYWVAPMDANYRRDGPGKSPMGMDLVPVYADQAAAAGTVRIDPGVVANLGIRTAEAQRGPLPRRVESVGFVSYDEETIQHLHTRVEGWVESLSVTTTGDPVRAGQRLFELYSPTLVNAQKEFLASFDDSEPSFRRASRERLDALGMEQAVIERIEREGRVLQRVPFTARNDGFVAHLGVREGMFVSPATEVMSIAQLDSVWLVAEVLERQAGWIEAGQRALVTLDQNPGDTLEGVVDYVYPELDPVSRTLQLRLRLANPGTRLRPNMYASVAIEGRPTGPIVHVPREAVIRSGSGSRIVVRDGDEQFSVRDVLVGIESGDRVAIRRGLRENERVVVSGQFLIDSEASVGSALDRLAEQESAEAGPGS